jgi:hypothetical protein
LKKANLMKFGELLLMTLMMSSSSLSLIRDVHQ